MDAIVQLLRNALSCVKDLHLFSNTFLWDPFYTTQFYNLPPPMNKTTPLEVIISVTQFYAFWSTTKNGWNLVLLSYGKIHRIDRLITKRRSKKTKGTTTDRLIHDSLIKEAFFAARSMFIGTLLFFIGLAFFWLFANSYHVTETDWLGGAQGLIHALTVMEVALLPLLYFMYQDGTEQLAKSTRLQKLSQTLSSQQKLTPSELGLSSFEAIAKWVPFWDAGISPFAKVSQDEDKLMAQEEKLIESTLQLLLKSEDDDKDDKNAKAKNQEYLLEQAELLSGKAQVTRWEGYRELVYFVINSVAFYGYLMAVLAFYWPDEKVQPTWIRSSMGNYTNAEADWMGNFAGDVMWTIEPIIALGSPVFLKNYFKSTPPKKAKVE